MEMKALTLVLIGALGLSGMAQAELVTTQSKPSIQASLKALHGSNLDVSVFDQLMTTHLQDVAAGKVHGNQSILDISLYSLEDSSAKSRFAALRQPNLLNATTATAEQLKLPTLKLVKKTVAGTTIDSVEADTFNTLAKIVSQTLDIENWAGSNAEKHQQSVENILQEVWLKNVEKWDSDIVKGKLNPSFYPDLIALVNHATSHNQVPSIETFRQLLDASIVLARGQNYPDTTFGKKLYEKSLSNVSDALATYLILTTTAEQAKEIQLSAVKTQIGEHQYTLPAFKGEVLKAITQKTIQTSGLFVAKLSSEHDRYVKYHNDEKNKEQLIAESGKISKRLAQEKTELAQEKTELAQEKTELAQTQTRLKQLKTEGVFLDEAIQVQNDFLAALNIKDDTKISKLKSIYTKLQALNSRADSESSDPRIKNTLLAITKLCEEQIADK